MGLIIKRLKQMCIAAIIQEVFQGATNRSETKKRYSGILVCLL